MKIPKKIKVCGRTYRVAARHVADGTMGETDSANRTIMIDPSVGARAYEVVLHELVHAALFETGVDNLMQRELTEAVCDAVALAFSDIFEFKAVARAKANFKPVAVGFHPSGDAGEAKPV